MIEVDSVSREKAAVVDTNATAQRMLLLLLDVLGPLDNGSPDVIDEATPKPGLSPAEASEVWSQETAEAGEARRHLRHLLDPTQSAGSTHEPAGSDYDPTGLSSSTLEAVDDTTQQGALQTWLALSQISDILGPGQLAAVDRQTDLQALPGEVLQAIEMHLDDDRLSSFGKVLKIGHLLLGQGFPSQ